MQRTITSLEAQAARELDLITRGCKNKAERLVRYGAILCQDDGHVILNKVLEFMHAERLVKVREVVRTVDGLNAQMPANPSDEDTINSLSLQIAAANNDQRLVSYNILTSELAAFIQLNPVRELSASASSASSFYSSRK